MLGVLPGIIGTIQATEAIKLILGIGEPLIGRLMLFDALAMRFRELQAAQEPGVPGLRRAPDGHRADRLRAVLRHRAGPSQAGLPAEKRITPKELAAELRRPAIRRC